MVPSSLSGTRRSPFSSLLYAVEKPLGTHHGLNCSINSSIFSCSIFDRSPNLFIKCHSLPTPLLTPFVPKAGVCVFVHQLPAVIKGSNLSSQKCREFKSRIHRSLWWHVVIRCCGPSPCSIYCDLPEFPHFPFASHPQSLWWLCLWITREIQGFYLSVFFQFCFTQLSYSSVRFYLH